MSNSPSVLTSVRWNELFPWLILVRAARVALMVRVLALALVGVILTQVGWITVDKIFRLPDEFELTQLTDRPPPRLWDSPDALYLVDPNAAVAGESSLLVDGAPLRSVIAERLSTSRLFEAVDARRYAGPAVRGWAWAMQPFSRMIDTPGWRRWSSYLASGVWSLAVWALFGGAIARIAALYLARGETIGPIEALTASASKWLSAIGSPLFCLVIIAVLGVMLALAGLMIKLGLFAVLLGLVWFLVILGGVAIAIVAIGLFLGWPLMWSTIAVERTDAFDGISRGYAYVYQRPLHLVFFLLVVGVLGLLAQTAVSVFVDASLKATYWAVEGGAGEARVQALLDPPTTEEGENALGYMDWAGGKLIRFWTIGALWVARSFPMAYLWPAATGIYLLLRRLIDSTEMSEASFDEGPPSGGLPTLVTDPGTGVPHVEPTEPASGSP